MKQSSKKFAISFLSAISLLSTSLYSGGCNILSYAYHNPSNNLILIPGCIDTIYVPTGETVSVDLSWHCIETDPGFANLWHNGSVIESQSANSMNAVSFFNLQANNRYKIEIGYMTGCYKEVVILEKSTMGVPDEKKPFELELFPNPTADKITIRSDEKLESGSEILVTDLSGKNILNFKLEEMTDKLEKEIDLRALPAGTYYIYLRSSKQQIIKKIIKL